MIDQPRTPRFYIDPADATLAPATQLRLPDSKARHAAQVLRLRAGDGVVLFDGRGGEYCASIESVGRREVLVALREHVSVERESILAPTLVQAVLAADMMDLVVRKAVELGAARVVPVRTRRSQTAGGDRAERRALHWRQIAIAACEQCGRNRLAEIEPLREFSELVAALEGAFTVALLPDAPASLLDVLGEVRPRSILIGPEGGFTSAEVGQLEARGVHGATLGARTLRAETAAIAALAIVDALGPER